MDDQQHADDHLKDVDQQSDGRLVSEHSEEAPQVRLTVKLGWVVLVLDDHDELEDEEGGCHYEHQNAQKLFEFDVGGVAA